MTLAPGLPPGDACALTEAPAEPVALTDAERAYLLAARAPSTLQGYRSGWAQFEAWCGRTGLDAEPASASTLARFVSELAGTGRRLGTIGRRIAAVQFHHQLKGLPNPTSSPRFRLVWEGIRRTHGAPPQQAVPLLPPLLDDVLAACPTTRVWRTRPSEIDLAGLRDRALLLVGFTGALRRSELVGLQLDQVVAHPEGLVLVLPRSKTNQVATVPEYVVLPRAADPRACPVLALQAWLDAAGLGVAGAPDPELADGPLLRPVSRGNRALARHLHPESANALVQHAIARAGHDPAGYSSHSLRAGFVTYCYLLGLDDRSIAKQTRHSDLTSVDAYVRVLGAWKGNAATRLGR